MSLTRMQIDMQQAIANGIRNYKAFYNSLIFNEQTREYQGFFWYSDEIKIKIQDNKMLFEITTDETKVNSLSKEEIEKIKQNDIMSRSMELAIQSLVEEKFGGHIMSIEEHSLFDDMVANILEGADEEENYREISTLDKKKLVAVREVFKNEFNLEFDIYDGESFAYLELVQDEITLNKKMLNTILKTLELLDTFIIAPQFNEESEEVEGVRLFFGIDLSVEEE